MAKKRKKVRNKTKVKPVNYLDRLNRLKESSFKSDVVPEFVGVTKPNEFTRFDGSIVPSGITYHIKYDGEAKTELYLTGERFTDESIGLIRIKGESSFGQYRRLMGKLTYQEYFEPYVFEPKKKDFKRGFAYRFFARKRFGNKDVIEISETDFKRNQSCTMWLRQDGLLVIINTRCRFRILSLLKSWSKEDLLNWKI